ncbi:hybrid-cluster NAD(P)-dependent oxidoreductase [Vibrio sp. S11_S32]|uniref:hybrid-cluster NAD(P)-dependent oxidoreductase n=1 Tax=Vibrio sp. S11_S32 TaxID=2720225 RepID=UPI0016809FDC|nr:hybrid-cluster NAD(P)-dependent oxidoreductase [Vibrio sp. S11_S32]MBD1576467.1 hybrid-cluster NAD(P)-dependent oxidoreductase [Vibrio sp. S11_S32]
MTQFQWPSNGPATLVCKRKWAETSNSVSFTLAPESINDQDIAFNFIPGQFITLGIEIDGKMEYRAYSLSSMPNQTELQLTIKRVAGGKVSNYIVDSLQEGQAVSVLKPAGEFHIERRSQDQAHGNRIVLLSAGCGITPVMSMAKTLLANKDDSTDIHFIHAATQIDQIIYHQELLAMAEQHARFHVSIMLEYAKGSDYLEGRLTQAALANYCADIAERTTFLCGPVGFMGAMQENLQALGMDMDNFYQESFTPAESTQPDVELNNADKVEALANATIFVPTFGAQVEAKIGSALIDALEAAKVPVIAACRSGICGSCKCKVTKGEFTRTSTETLTVDEIEQGFVLACSCQVHSDLEVALN